jgi:DNA polymerase III epsilon subunit-like protein
MTRTLCAIDTETTSLGPDRRPWEIAVLYRETDGTYEDFVAQVWDVDLSNADPASLKFGKFYERHIRYRAVYEPVPWLREEEAAKHIERITRGATIVGANPSFDTECLSAMLRRHGLIPAWHYRLMDVEALTAGHLGREVGGLAACAEALGIPFPESEQHTALGDARAALAIYDAILGGDE